MIALPIDPMIPAILEAVHLHQVLIVTAAPGTGKTTRVPIALSQHFKKKILVLQPRRMAASNSASRVAQETNTQLGAEVGYQVRHDNCTSRDTQLIFMTDGLFLRILHDNPILSDVDCVVLDEFHERNVNTDVAFTLVRMLQRSRNDLRLVIMSATLDVDDVKSKIANAQSVHCPGIQYPVEVRYWNENQESVSLISKVFRSVITLLGDPKCTGNILVFLPGAFEIRQCMQELQNASQVKDSCFLMELRSDTPAHLQKLVFEASARRKVILATNVAETSVTIPGVTGVIDSGLAKISGFADWSGLPTLILKPISQANCTQRAGRAGRTCAGVAIRLFSEADFRRRPEFQKPEMERCDLAQIVLDLHCYFKKSSSTSQWGDLAWLDAPAPERLLGCEALLVALGALDGAGNPTPLGQQMSALPMHPRISKIVIENLNHHHGAQGCLAAAMISEDRQVADIFDWSECDLFSQMQKFEQWLNNEHVSVDTVACHKISKVWQQLCGAVRVKAHLKLDFKVHCTALLAAFYDRVGYLDPKTKSVRLAQGGKAQLDQKSTVQQARFLIAITAEESKIKTSLEVKIRTACSVEESLLVADAKSVRKRETFWDTSLNQVRASDRVYWGGLVVKETIIALFENPESVLFQALVQHWPKPFDGVFDIEAIAIRHGILTKIGVHHDFQPFSDLELELLQTSICEGKKSFSEIAVQPLAHYIESFLDQGLVQDLKKHCPSHIAIGKNKKVKIHYEANKPPWVATRMQDFFGCIQSPKIAMGRIPLVMHLMGPNGLPVQVTSDLEGFWKSLYPTVRKEMSRRYPRHFWPEDPSQAEPPEPKVRRRHD